MRFDLILSETNTVEEIAGPASDLVQHCRNVGNSNHVILVEAKTPALAARYCSFVRILRRQCVPGLELYLSRLKVHKSKQSDRKFFEFTFNAQYNPPVNISIENDINGFRHDVKTGRLYQLSWENKDWTPEFKRFLTCSSYQLTQDFFSILERTSGEFELELFGDTLFEDTKGECYDDHLHEKMRLYACSNRTRGNLTAAHYFQEVFLLAETTGRRLVGYCWDKTDLIGGGRVELTWLFKGASGVGPDSIPRTVDVNYESYDKIVPFMIPMVERFLVNIRPEPGRYVTWMTFIEDDRKRFESDLLTLMPKYCPELVETPNWKRLATPSFETFKIPELTKVYERYENITFMFDNDDEAKITQVRALYNSDTTDMITFIEDHLGAEKRKQYEYLFSKILPAPSADRLQPKLSFNPFFGDYRRKSTIVSVFGEEVYRFQKDIQVLKKAGAYANEVLFIDVKGFVNNEITDLTLVCVGIMKKIELFDEGEDIARSRYEN